MCPRCGGAGKWREKGDTWTRLEDLPREILVEIARVRKWMHINEEAGTILFIEGVGLPSRDDNLLELLKIIGQIGPVLEQNNWLVKY